MFERMQRAYRFTRRPPEFLLTHPLSETRIADAKNQARSYPTREPQRSIAFQMMKVKVEGLYEKNPIVSLQKYKKLVEKNPSNIAARYGFSLALVKNSSFEEAVDEFEALRPRLPNTILMLAAYAEVLASAGQHQKAEKIVEKRLAISPDNQPLSMIHAKTLIATKRFKEAEKILIRLSKVRPNDVDIWYELAETSGLAGNISGVHIARAEYFVLHGAYTRSIQHLEYAKSLTRGNNPQLQAKLAQQIQDLKTQVRLAKG